MRVRGPSSSSGVSAVVAIILLVAITVVLTGFLYLIVIDLAQSTTDVPPRVLLFNSGNPVGRADFTISSADPRPLTEFRFRLWINESLDAASDMNPVVVGTVGNITFAELDAGGTMTDGDTVVVSTAPDRSYEIALLWKGNLVHSFEWST